MMAFDTRLHVHIPYAQLSEHGPFLLERQLQPEIAFKGPELEGLNGEDLTEWGQRFRQAGRRIAVHAPFMDLNPGALDPLVSRATATRLEQTLRAAAALGAHRVVVHPGYDRWRYAGNDDLWVDQCLAFWPPLLQQAEDYGLLLALENVFEDSPDNLEKLFQALDSPVLGHCFDVGHWYLFCRSRGTLVQWFSRLGKKMIHLHLHDNHGDRDEHLPPGEGRIDFSSLFTLIEQHAPAATMTLEAHDRDSLVRALESVKPLLRI